MIWTAKIAMVTVALVSLGGAAAASSSTVSHAAGHMAQTASDILKGHRSPTAADCAEWRNHGAYVSSVARAQGNESRDDKNETKDRDNDSAAEKNETRHGDDARENRSAERNETRSERDERNETRSDDRDATSDGAVRDAAHSDIGKGCHKAAHDDRRESEPSGPAGTAAAAAHGQGAEHRHTRD